MLTDLPRVIADKPDRPDLGDLAAQMRALTLEIAMNADAWTPDRTTQMTGFFDSVASGWSDRDRPERHDALGDALARGGPFPRGVCLEVGAGTGNATGDLQAAFDDVISIDLSLAMLSLASPKSQQIQADSSRLPVRAGSVAVVALINMFLFPAEVARVLKPDGVVLWVSTNGDATPIYLAPAEVLEALGTTWHGTTAQAGWGTWTTARRTTARGARSGGRSDGSADLSADEFWGPDRSHLQIGDRGRNSRSVQRQSHISQVQLIVIPVSDQERSVAFYEGLGFERRNDISWGDGYRWVEVYPVDKRDGSGIGATRAR